jgi:hypothetical protein
MRAKLWLVLLSSCAHSQLSSGDLSEVTRPAFVSRVVENAGPQSDVFRGDSSYTTRLQNLSAAEGDRRLANKLTTLGSMTGFQLSDTLRASVVDLLPARRPWTETVNPADVARVLETFLVREESTREPDYERLKSVSADAVVELIIESYGMRSRAGRCGVFVQGTARMFRLNGGTLYRRQFISDESAPNSNVETMDPFAVAKDPTLFRERLTQMLGDIARLVAADLNPGQWNRTDNVKEGPGESGNAPTPAGQQPAPSANDPL